MSDKREYVKVLGRLQSLKVLKGLDPHPLSRRLVDHDHVDPLAAQVSDEAALGAGGRVQTGILFRVRFLNSILMKAV